MAAQTGENEQALRKILDMTRLISIVILVLHFYYYCYAAFSEWELTLDLTDQLMGNIKETGLFSNFHKSKLIALGFLIISLMGAKGNKDEKLNYKAAFAYIITGLLIYFFSYLFLLVKIKMPHVALLYMGLASTGFLLVLSGGTLLSRIIKRKFNNKDIFNKENETFPQEERLLINEFSINLPAQYQLKDKTRKSWINIINPFRALLVLGSPGSGKSYFVIRHVITQHIKKGFSMFVYVLSGNDFKLDINNPDSPKIVCMDNNPQKIQVYGAVLSLYVTRLIKMVNKKGNLKSSLVFDEFPTIYHKAKN